MSETNKPPSETAVAILGATGALGFGLAVRLATAGIEVVIGSRDEARAGAAAERASAAVPGGVFRGLENAEAAQQAAIVVLTVPFATQAATLKALAPVLQPGQILVDTTVPLAPAVGGRPTRLVGVWQGSAAEQARELVPDGVSVVAALHTVSAASLTDLATPLDEDVPVCGDRKDDRRRVAELIARIDGLRPVDAGVLDAARLIESLTPLLIRVNSRYKAHAGVRVVGLPDDGAWPG